VVLCSPLSRAIETATLAFAYKASPPIELSALCSERCLSTCDRGLKKADLLRRWPHVAFWRGTAELGEVWWPAERSLLQEFQPIDRMQALKAMLAERREHTICVVGHAGIFATLTGRHLRNCKVLWCDLVPGAGASSLELIPCDEHVGG